MLYNYDKIPEELRWDKNWALAGPDDKGQYKAPYGFGPRGPFKIKTTQDLHWRDFESVIEAAEQYAPAGIGYILSKKCSYTCIDLDVKNEHNYPNKVDIDGKPIEWTTPEQLDRFWKIIQAFDSYTERSASGQGFHIWVRGKIGAGCKRDGVEVYSQERFIVCTGNVVVEKDIEDRQDLLDILVGEINNAKQPKIELVDIQETESDDTILERARNAENSDKFNKLFSGDWDGYPSQSEADLALLSIFTFYSKSNIQCRRLFRLSGLGQRAKATKNDRYLNDTLRLIRGREAREEQVDTLGASIAASLMQQFEREKLSSILEAQAKQPATKQEYVDQETGEILPVHLIPDDKDLPFEETLQEDNSEGLSYPPGLAGALARHIFKGAPRPVKEVAIVAALGLLAGICGKAYTIPQSGLNMYIVLVAASGVGKETMHSGIAQLLNSLASKVPTVMSFVDFSEYASGQALQKAVSSNQSFLNISGEFGRRLARLAQEDGRDGPMQTLRTQMTHLYQKSAPKSIVGGIGYSDKEKNIASVSGVAYSMIGESTPGKFYDSLTEGMMEDGFLSRFIIVEYKGQRPRSNKIAEIELDPVLEEGLCSLIQHASKLNEDGVNVEVQASPDAEKILDAFDEECDDEINSMDEDDHARHMWNRAHLKAKRLAAMFAAADNHIHPVISLAHVEWAIMLIRKDIAIMSRRMATGDVGMGDSSRIKKMLSILKKYLEAPVPASYKIPEGMQKDAVVPRKYLQICTQRSTSFTQDKRGQISAMDSTIKALIDNGAIQELDKAKAAEKYNFVGKCYRIIDLGFNTEERRNVKKVREVLNLDK